MGADMWVQMLVTWHSIVVWTHTVLKSRTNMVVSHDKFHDVIFIFVFFKLGGFNPIKIQKYIKSNMHNYNRQIFTEHMYKQIELQPRTTSSPRNLGTLGISLAFQAS